MGTLDWEDVETMVDEAINQGIADPQKLAIAGHSQGGFLAAWACTQTNRFKAAVAAAGISDWGTLILQSDLPDLEVSPCFPGFTYFLICSLVRLIWPEARRGLQMNQSISNPAQSDTSKI
jgi:acetyl esterase/lipase